VTFDDAFKSVAEALPILHQLHVPATVFACSEYADGGRPLDVPELSLALEKNPDELATMDWSELRELIKCGVEVGSHTHTHAHLTRLSDAELHEELSGSRERLEDRLGAPCPYLAYPYGEQDARVRAAAQKAGYEAAFALPGRRHGSDRYQVPRIGIWRKDGLVTSTLKTTALGPWMKRLRRPAAARPAPVPPTSKARDGEPETRHPKP
jgi:peptidoglycan/xylan/chitin deacetylase (PgdA/CDA1 family)